MVVYDWFIVFWQVCSFTDTNFATMAQYAYAGGNNSLQSGNMALKFDTYCFDFEKNGYLRAIISVRISVILRHETDIPPVFYDDPRRSRPVLREREPG